MIIRAASPRACGNHRMVWTGKAIADRNMPGGEIDQIGRNEEWRQAARAALVQDQRPFRDPREAPDPGTDHDAGALARLFIVRLPAGVLHRLSCGSQRKDDEPIHLTLILGRYPIIGVEQSRSGVATRHLSS